MVLRGQMDYPVGHAQPDIYNTGYGQPSCFGPGYSQPYQPTNLGGYPYMGYGKHDDYGSENAHHNGNSSSLQQVRLYPNSAASLPSKHQMVAPEGYDKHLYDHGIKPQGYRTHGYDKPSKNDYYGNNHGYEKPSMNDYYGNAHGDYEKLSKNDYYGNAHGDYEKHSKTDYYGNAHGDYEKHSKTDYYGNAHSDYEKHSKNDYYGNPHGGYEKHSNGHEGYGNGKYPSHGANRVESMSYNYYSSNGQENKNRNWILKGLDD